MKNRTANESPETSTDGASGGKPPQPPRTTASTGDEPRRLPGEDLTPEEQARLPKALPLPRHAPPSTTRLASENLIGEGWEHFGAKEIEIAEILRWHGVEVRSVGETTYSGPDAVTADLQSTIEFKTATGKNGIYRGLRKSRSQSRRVFVNARNAPTSRDQAITDLTNVLRRGGGDMDEVSILLPDGSLIRWEAIMKTEATILVDGIEPAVVAAHLAVRFGTLALPDSRISGEEAYGYKIRWPNWDIIIEPDAIDFGIDGYATTVLFVESNSPNPGQIVFEQLARKGWRVALLDEDASEIVRESKPAQVA